MSWLYKFINKITLWVVLAQIAILVVAVLIEKHLVSLDSVQNNPYIADDTKYATAIEYVWLFLAYILLFSNFVPISLQVTIDFTRYFQSLVIANDQEMRISTGDAPRGSRIIDVAALDKKKTVRVQSSELNEELGMVEHVFTDKTGTLTCNRMEFRTCHIDGKTYEYDFVDGGLRPIDQTQTPRRGRASTPSQTPRQGRALTPSQTPRQGWASTTSPRTDESATTSSIVTLQKYPQIHKFFVNLAANNSITPGGVASTLATGETLLEYSGPSPDERALVMAAARSGVKLKRRNNTHIFLCVYGQDVEYEILHNFEFTSDRKKSSILCREIATGRLILFCKGADTVILAALSGRNHSGRVLQAKEQILVYSSNGLRVLCIAEREITEAQYQSWLEKFVAARSGANKDGSEEDVDRVISELEQELMFVGVSGIEDKIQEGAPETLEKFRAAGIKVWMLTGDRPDTATNVAYSVRLISSEMKLVKLVDNQWLDSKTTAIQFLQNELTSFKNDSRYQAMAVLLNDVTVEAVRMFGIENEFLNFCMHCESVLCARISPKQKEFIVEMVREFCPTKVTMAVGDGANDVPMIQRAHIGIGIAGEEGHQASDASDYSIPMFKHLQQLVLVHGRRMNRRVSILTLYIFYKNVLLVLPQFVYGCYCLYSGQSTYYDTLLQLFNIFFTSLPVMCFAVFDIDISAQTCLAHPKLYQDGFLHTFLNVQVFMYWMLEATISSILIVLVPAKLIPLVPWSHEGKDNDLWSMGLAQNFTVVVLANLRLYIEVSSNNRAMIVLIMASLLFWWVVVYFVSSYVSFGREFYGILHVGGVTGLFLCCVFCTVTGLFSSVLPKVWNVLVVPNARTICREMDWLNACTHKGSDTVFPIDRDESSPQIRPLPQR
uniref:Phospholipid-transporting ATPase n=1 Tax=Globisporangium ultimum (strain ATCC 200006 / CBS 805.95 / DAOM BR144) TaxID=431595 RepID=K3WUP7_GLOUD